jgi:putative photosynthetic complex assembly protein 2
VPAGPVPARGGPLAAVPAAGAAGLAAAVVLFWWGVTGVLLALQRSAGTRLVALAVAVLSAVAGLWLTAGCGRAAAHSEDGSAGAGGGAAARAVLAGALLWTCVSAAFYGGWVVGPEVAPPAGPHAVTLGRAARAVAATSYSSLLTLALLAAAWRLAVPNGAAGPPAARAGAAARFAPLTLAALWAAHELAKLNVFLGVANPGAELLPTYLASLRAYFGPARNSPLLAPSVAALAAATAAAGLAAWRARGPAGRVGFALLAGVLALAAFEHAVLGVPEGLDWWDAFLRWRGSA